MSNKDKIRVEMGGWRIVSADSYSAGIYEGNTSLLVGKIQRINLKKLVII